MEISQSTLQSLRDHQLEAIEEKATHNGQYEMSPEDREILQQAYENTQPLSEYNQQELQGQMYEYQPINKLMNLQIQT